MTEEVLIGIRGLHSMETEAGEDIEVVFPASCRKVGDTWYIRYTEPVEGFDGQITTLIKLKSRYMEVSKRGLTRTTMVFEEGKRNLTWYETPLGAVQLGISATGVSVEIGEDMIRAEVVYALEADAGHMADCRILLTVTPRKGKSRYTFPSPLSSGDGHAAEGEKG